MRNFLRGFFENNDQPEVQVIRAQPGDERGINEVMYQAWLATYPNAEHGITKEDIEVRWKDRFSEEWLAKRKEDFAHPKEGVRVLVAKSAGKVVGMCRVEKGAECNRLQAIYVHPAFHGRGVGKALAAAAEHFLDPRHDTYVDVVIYNTKAIGFYEKLGFRDTGVRKEDDRFRLKSGAIFKEMEMVRKATA